MWCCSGHVLAMKLGSVLLLLSRALGEVVYVDDADADNQNIKQIVVLMMENRSFDTFLGRLKLDKHYPDVNGPTGQETNPLVNGTQYRVHNYDPTEVKELVDPYDPTHEVGDVTEQIYGRQYFNGSVKGVAPTMSGFAASVERNAGVGNSSEYPANGNISVEQGLAESFGLHGAATLPVTYALAQEFSVIDDWFASVPGPTYPNRHFLHCATSLGQTVNVPASLLGVNCKTTFSNMNSKLRSWGFYSDNKLNSISALLYTDLRWPWNLARIHHFDEFVEHAKKGSLPQYSYIDPDFAKNDNHPPHNLYDGEAFVKTVYETLRYALLAGNPRASPQWSSTLLVITYDEHGGFWDHVPPPTDIPIPDGSKVTPPSGDFKFDRLGVRVPTILVSPWIPKGKVFRSGVPGRHFEHSSVSATLKKKFGLDRFLTKRDEWALSFHSVTNYLQQPRADCMTNITLY
ncbi:hypothetical protein HDV03_005021 [Kappamyces sp. JEL0829]|nr:hypothetical protein HDV03_005021 [Kappamyces sp. JEL0829]